ncbi:hypothetical protein ACWD4G_20055 [Streptomyces sp. NPDC002643]
MSGRWPVGRRGGPSDRPAGLEAQGHIPGAELDRQPHTAVREFRRGVRRRLRARASAVLAARGRRAVEFGAAWLIGGLLAAVVTHDQAEGALGYVVSWGPMLYGVLRIATGVRLLVRSRESP